MTGRKLFYASKEMIKDPSLNVILEDLSKSFEAEMSKKGSCFIYTSKMEGPFLHSDDFIKNRQTFYRDYYFEPTEIKEDE